MNILCDFFLFVLNVMEMWGDLNKAQSEPCIVIFNLYGETDQIAHPPTQKETAMLYIKHNCFHGILGLGVWRQ